MKPLTALASTLLLLTLLLQACSTSSTQAAPQPPSPATKPATHPTTRAAATRPAPSTQPAHDLTLDLGKNISIQFVLIPAGKFLMGNPADEPRRIADEPLPKEVTIAKPFYMSIYEVTQQQYKQIMGDNPSRFRGPQNPVDNVNYDDAVDFAAAFSKATGRSARLPSEAQWEYACRAGSTTRLFYGEDKDFAHLADYAWYQANSDRQTHPVGQKKPNAWGLYDMYGNVWEWCAQGENPPADTANFRPIRGGGWMNAPWLLSSARRAADPHTTAADHLGIRLILDIK